MMFFDQQSRGETPMLWIFIQKPLMIFTPLTRRIFINYGPVAKTTFRQRMTFQQKILENAREEIEIALLLNPQTFAMIEILATRFKTLTPIKFLSLTKESGRQNTTTTICQQQ